MGHTKTNWGKRALAAEAKLQGISIAIAKVSRALDLDHLEDLLEVSHGTSNYYSPSRHFEQKEQELAAMTAERDRYKALSEELIKERDSAVELADKLAWGIALELID